jgi:hypothetical protein
MFIAHPASLTISTSAPDSAAHFTLSRAIVADISGYFTEKVPPNPQHCSAFRSGTTATFPKPPINRWQGSGD